MKRNRSSDLSQLRRVIILTQSSTYLLAARAPTRTISIACRSSRKRGTCAAILRCINAWPAHLGFRCAHVKFRKPREMEKNRSPIDDSAARSPAIACDRRRRRRARDLDISLSIELRSKIRRRSWTRARNQYPSLAKRSIVSRNGNTLDAFSRSCRVAPAKGRRESSTRESRKRCSDVPVISPGEKMKRKTRSERNGAGRGEKRVGRAPNSRRGCPLVCTRVHSNA